MATASAGRRLDLWSRLVDFANRINFTYWLMVGGSAAARHLPLRVTYQVAAMLGDLVFYTWPDKRRAALANMRRVLGPHAQERVVWRTARDSYRNYLKYTVDFLRFSRMSREQVRALTRVEGIEHVDQALADGKGVLFVGMHFGHYDLGAAILAIEGYPVNAVVDSFQPPRLNELIQRGRTEKGLKVIEIAAAGRAVLRALRQNEILGLLIDRPLPGEGVQVRFFGAPIEIPAGAATLALKTGAPILPAYIVRLANNLYHGVVLPRVEFRPSGEIQRDVVALTQQVVSALEQSIRQHPEQWYMFRQMWPDQALQKPGAI